MTREEKKFSVDETDAAALYGAVMFQLRHMKWDMTSDEDAGIAMLLVQLREKLETYLDGE